jgi:hypothetical protein
MIGSRRAARNYRDRIVRLIIPLPGLADGIWTLLSIDVSRVGPPG